MSINFYFNQTAREISLHTKKISPIFRSLAILVFFALGLNACASLGLSKTPTPEIPTTTPIPPTPTPPPFVAAVNGEYITNTEFQIELEGYTAAQTARGVSFTKEEANKVVLEDLIAQYLLAQAAREENFVLTESDLQSRIDTLTTEIGGAAALSAWLESHHYDEASFRIALKRSIEAAWMRDKIIADVPARMEQIHLRQILTYNQADVQSALEQLAAGADFDELAALYDPVALGELGWIPPGYLLSEEADLAVFALQEGQYSEIVSTDAGFHIFKVLERKERALSPDALLTLQESTLLNWVAEKRADSEIILAP